MGIEEGARQRGLDSYKCDNKCEFTSGGTKPRFAGAGAGIGGNEI